MQKLRGGGGGGNFQSINHACAIMTFNTWQDNCPSMVVPCVISRLVVGLYVLEMDVNYLRDANLLPPKHSTSKVL